MNNQAFSWDSFSSVPIVGIVRNLSFDIIEKILPIYLSSGLTCIEFTMNTPQASEIIKYAASNYKGRLNIGAGTVCNTHDLKLALDAGAQFIVTPILDVDVVKICVKAKIPVFPGAYTPTEIYQAWQMGASMVKVFPATSLGPEYIRDVKAPLNQIKLMPTGGVNIENITNFMNAGADGVGIGSQLFDKTLIKNEDWNSLEIHFKKFIKKLVHNS